jgi:hypothetical protein
MSPHFLITQSTTPLICANPVNQTIENVLTGLSGRMKKLQEKYLAFGRQGNISGEFTQISSEESIKNSDGSPMTRQGKI